jgi:hypothetical protein
MDREIDYASTPLERFDQAGTGAPGENDYAMTPLERFFLSKLVDPRLNYGREIIADY